MSDITGRQHKWLLRNYCNYSTNALRIKNDINLEDYDCDIYIERGATLRINNRVHLPARAAIYVEPGARLLLGPNAILHNGCGEEWKGIRVGVTESGYRGEVVADPEAIMLNEAS